ncbi:hypothetical protein [Bacillus altitudinis]|uniref:hypothetical protein n=1 Tax=Bacillus altitudinis TaxID=293387 RepID=UPI002FFEB6B5
MKNTDLDYFRKSMYHIRTLKKVGSRELSRKIGKAETYISQFERGLIKSPDYQICFDIMKELGFAEKDIGRILFDQFKIMSPEAKREQENIEAAEDKQLLEKYNDPVYLEEVITSLLSKDKNPGVFKLESKVYSIANLTIDLINSDIDIAEKLIKDMGTMVLNTSLNAKRRHKVDKT